VRADRDEVSRHGFGGLKPHILIVRFQREPEGSLYRSFSYHFTT
jgi:hypothetical protein